MSLRPPHPSQRLIHLLQIESFRPEPITGPLTVVIEFFMIRLEDDLQKFLISPDAAYVFWWATPLPAEAKDGY